ncbi:MAG TPA: PucR family transcriptional regulator, partial [Mycobacterium sp.]|nr:PucR family transcriptional regulator [Mycobacterium sp.]
MPDKQPPLPRTTLDLLDSVPESLLRGLKQYSGRLSTEAVNAMQEGLPFFAELEASQRASVALVVQTAVVNFVEWLKDPSSNVNYTARAFELMPQDLTRRIALRHSVEMVRFTMEFFEEVVPLLARSDEQLTALMIGILKYSRDLAFSAATAYADAAEARGSWDSRMEASVVDAVVRGDTGPELLSRAAALNWDTTAPATVVVGTPPPGREDRASQDVRDIAVRHGRAALIDVHGPYLVAIVSGQLTQTEKVFGDLLDAFSDGPVVIGPTAPMLTAAYHSASEAISGMNAVAGWRGAPRPVLARELLPERALMGDASAIAALHTDVMRPLADAGPTLTETLDAYLDCGGAIEACARKLFVHPNTVRYRLRRIADFTGRDPTLPRDAYVLRVAA